MSARPAFNQPQTLETAQLVWQEATPVAGAFDDVYFSRDQGPEETRYVFLEQNDLPQRWANWQQPRAFVVGETGFGTGLNLLVAMQVFLETAPQEARLHWISTELFPLNNDDLAQAHQHWPALAEFATSLQAQYPLPISGFHRLHLHPRITLDLLLGDAASNLAGLKGKVDAWCLDGFAPSKNPDMWTPELFAALARASHPQTTFATFTSAGLVKRGMETAGFKIEKVAGFGRKREMLRGHYPGPSHTQASAPWYELTSSQVPVKRVAVVGGGLSGLATAEALIRRGLKVDLYEAEQPGNGGSGNRQGVLYIKLAIDTTLASRFYLAGLEYSRRWLQRLDPYQKFWKFCGVLQLALDAKEASRQSRFLTKQQLPYDLVKPVDQAEASLLAGTPTAAGGLFYPRAGWVKPGDLCRYLAETLEGLEVHTQSPVESLKQQAQGWEVITSQGSQAYDTVILAAAQATQQLTPTQWLPTKAIRGQVSHLPLEPQSAQLPTTVVCAGGYVSPPLEGKLCFGASFNLRCDDPTLRLQDHQSNWEELTASLPDLNQQLASKQPNLAELEGRVAFRCTSPDYLPLVGPAPDPNSWEEDYAQLKSNALWTATVQAHNLPGLWLNLGQGSRGLASIPLASELLASQICGEPAPLEVELVEALHPGRFIIRNLKRSSAN
ncbi:tRNA 5-methylaminomethyl-2-thiouridine biosynthesis bifunctional protein [Marinospirillum celere]|uniref:tRNA 5-methylaminomethyl-2-thiouridine biosynthesis bifunctional protein MnmC n=1 Tax=Marinospirillum celere TaxID=1122252 RepID=A0A1I1J1K8_9GAMM|nr:bifunctional tRNA (5-methylaminomethyl-2-thiouridine)(34)-methyltransferase MnmD/FAD-dependent 5-carboxymethylaminomethyl-2-thiouridine(34) oxidoreductase MnmC [Marinospirillum celere]SFC40508.1 tRNA 5-methylaminomethyl-2-thiouridine biosynthesis bifunctional protein [Marinospirillum celere]